MEFVFCATFLSRAFSLLSKFYSTLIYIAFFTFGFFKLECTLVSPSASSSDSSAVFDGVVCSTNFFMLMRFTDVAIILSRTAFYTFLNN